MNIYLDFHLAAAAFLAMSERFFAVNDSALALPPFNPPNLPNIDAAAFTGSFSTIGSSISPVAIFEMSTALWFTSVGRFAFAMKQRYKTFSYTVKHQISN